VAFYFIDEAFYLPRLTARNDELLAVDSLYVKLYKRDERKRD
jgi:hypothetical protein